MLTDPKNLIWLDLEMTGLDTRNDRIIEIAIIITDSHLEILAEGPAIAIHQPADVLDLMGDWCTKQHHQSGLIDRVKSSTISESEAEATSLQFIKQYVPKNQSPMCGNSICMDRRFLARYMPKLENYFHYRNLDVSTIKILAQRWAGNLTKGFKKQSSHLALQDVRDSINELRFYREHFLKCKTSTT